MTNFQQPRDRAGAEPRKLASPHKMNDFQTGAGLERAVRPLGLFHDLGIQFDGDAAGVQAEGFQQLEHGDAVSHLAGFAIHYNPHGNNTQGAVLGPNRCILQ